MVVDCGARMPGAAAYGTPGPGVIRYVEGKSRTR